ncbi:MAG: hypothetical protein E7049_12095, partial [Lentisphaerae bacterium]|nr:hypothetical protein [Lentisphaerota bacterium]
DKSRRCGWTLAIPSSASGRCTRHPAPWRPIPRPPRQPPPGRRLAIPGVFQALRCEPACSRLLLNCPPDRAH